MSARLTVADLIAWLAPVTLAAVEERDDPDVLQAGVILSTVVACLLSQPVDRATLAALANTAALIARYKRTEADED